LIPHAGELAALRARHRDHRAARHAAREAIRGAAGLRALDQARGEA